MIDLGTGSHVKTRIEVPPTDNHYELLDLLDPKPELHGKSVLDMPLDMQALFAEWRRQHG